MSRRKVSILAVTVGFALVFTMLGSASIYMAGLQSETQERTILSNHAFWLAEAGINRSLTTDPPQAFPASNPPALGNGNYAAWVGTDPLDSALYTVRSTGLVNNFRRTVEIQARRRSYPIDSFLTYSGTLDQGGNSNFICGENEPNCVAPTQQDTGMNNQAYFQSLFGLTWEQMRAIATNTNPEQNPPQDEIAWSDGDMSVSGTNWAGSGILIVDGDLKITGSGDNPPDTFQGIIWVEGNFTNLAGNAIIRGAVFVNGDIKARGNADGYYSSEAIYRAFGGLGWSNYSLISWQENDNHVL